MIKKIIKKSLDQLGYQISLKSDQSQGLMFFKTINYFNFDLIIDVGANQGQSGKGYRNDGFKGKIISFEPLLMEYDILLKASKSDKLWEIAPRCAIGDFDGYIDINVSSNSGSSSALPMKEAHSDAAPDSLYIGKQNVPIFKLDTIMDKFLEKDNFKAILLKIDTQGFEWEVLDGSFELLKKVKGVTLELSFVELYEGQKLWHEILDRLVSLGFILWSIYPGFSDSSSGRMLQCDATFIRLS